MKKQLLAGLLALGMGIATQAQQINGSIAFTGGAQMDSGSVDSATKITSWLDQSSLPPTVDSRSGDFTGFVSVNDPVAFAAPWSFNSGAIPAFWAVGGFTFDLTSSTIDNQNFGFLNVSGTGTVSGNGFLPTLASWSFSAQDPPAGTVGTSQDLVFSFSASGEAVPRTTPDGGATLGFLGLALLVAEGLRRQLNPRKS